MPSKNADIPVIGPILNKIFGTRNDRFVKRYTQKVEAINALEPRMRALTDAELRAKTGEFRARLDKGEKPDDVLVEVFAAAREAMDRNVGIRNVFNPELKFDASRLPARARELYERTRGEMEALAPAEPTGRFLGCAKAQPGWLQADIPNEVYEAVRELYPESRPPFRARPFDVQLIGGMVLGQGKIAEMKTGEGKTIVAPLASYMACCQHQQVHVVTVNDYLVQRDRDWTYPFFLGLGLTVGAIHPQHQQPEDVKRQMYRCDVVYGTTSEFGFDYLRDNMKRSVDQQVQRKRQLAIVDEVDSILIDEARTPLIISGLAYDDAPRYDLADRLARHLIDKHRPWQQGEDMVTQCKETIKGLEGDIRQAKDKGRVPELQRKLDAAKKELPELERERDRFTQYFEVKPERKTAHLTHEGIAEAQRVAGVGSFYVDENMDLPHLLEQSVRAHAVYERDRDYIVMDMPDRVTGKSEPGVVIVDTNTGRPMIGRQWSDGLHQAVECKEGVPIKPETQTVASVTIQNFFKMYKRLAGMTGTADTEAQEFYDIYKLDVVSIPTNRDVVRRDFDDLMYLRGKDKWDGIVDEIKAFHDVGRPILVGTTSVEKSETLSRMLTGKHQIKHAVLNAKQHEREAQIITGAGHLGAVMIATNMAGRGTDIKLTGVSRQELLEHWLRRGIASRGLTVESSDEQLRENVFRKVAASELRDESLRKDEIEKMDFSELELRLLRHWAARYTWLTDAQIAKLGRDGLLTELDRTGRIALHRIRWFDSVEDLGGLHVIGTERHESRRIDNQLRGRSGRQGDKGSSRFYVACEDDLMKMFMGETTQKFLARFGLKEGEAIEHPWLSKNVERAQKKVEERNFQIRKNILEYDEVMEHQRQRFYGLRQRVLEGRQLSGLLFEYIEEAVDKAVEDYLDSDYAAQCAAEFAKDRLDASIAPDRLKGKDLEDMTLAIRKLAKDDAVELIRVTIGEYMPTEGSEAAVDFDAAGLSRWAKNRFGVDLDPEQLRSEGGGARTHVQAALEEAAAARIDGADLAGLSEFAEAEYGYRQLSAWAKRKFEIDVSVEELRAAHEREDKTGSARDPIVAKARELAAKREVEYPADHAMQVTMLIARQDAQQGFDYLARWVRQRFGRELTSEQIRSTPPNKMREQLRGWMQEFVDGGGLEKAVAEASAQPTDDALDAYLQKRFNVGITDRMRYLDPAERADAIRARVETIVRAELVQLEQVIFLDVLDHEWKDHLHAMDQLRDTIGFRQFSQQDPRIEYKREGQRQFGSTMERVRERVTDLAFRGRLQPHLPPPAPRPTTPGPTAMPTGAPAAQPGGLTPSAPASPGAIAPARPGPAFGSSISGPGFFMGPSVRPPAPPPGQPGPGQAGQGGPAGTPPTGTPPPPPA